jgi:ankyrin repeat protein
MRNSELLIASQEGSVARVRRLIASDANVNYQGKVLNYNFIVVAIVYGILKFFQNGVTALHFAAYRGHKEVVKMLLAAHADPAFADFKVSKKNLKFPR